MQLVQVVNSTYNEVDRNLSILEREEVLIQQHAEHKRIISLNFKNERTLILLKLLKIREDPVDLKHFRRNLKSLLENNNENSSNARQR